MVRHRLAVLLALLFGALWQAACAASFTVHLEDSRVELGKYTHLDLASDRAQPSLRTIDLSALQKSFFVDASADISRLNHTQHWRLRLYPRYAGRLTIAPLKFQASSSTSLPLEVTPAVDSKTGHQLQIQPSLSTGTAWLNQQVLINFVLVSKDRHVLLDSDSLELPTGKLYLLKQTTVPAKKTGYFRHTIGWAYFPQQAGNQMLQMPPIYYKRDGVITHRFYLPGQRLVVKPLPVYVPANFPVGELTLQVASSHGIFLTDRIHYLDATLQAKAIAQQQIPHLEYYLHGPTGIKLYPATTHIQQSAGGQGLISQIQLQLPIKAAHTGLVKLDDIAIQYFEPNSGKLRTLRYQWPTYIFVSPSLLVIGGLLLAILLGYGLLRIVKFSRDRWQQYQYWRQARRQLLAATTPQEIKAAIMLIAKAQQGLGNMTLHYWASYNKIDIESLSQALYQATTYDLAALKQPFLQLCFQKLRFQYKYF